MYKSEHIYSKARIEPYQTEKEKKTELDFINRVDHIFMELEIWNWPGFQLCFWTEQKKKSNWNLTKLCKYMNNFYIYRNKTPKTKILELKPNVEGHI